MTGPDGGERPATEAGGPFGARLPHIAVPPPGPASLAAGARLRHVESRNITRIDERWPVFWAQARGANVRDVDGNVYIDLTSAFGVALLGHRPDEVAGAVERQLDELLHGMGDIHPPLRKLELLERLSAIGPWDETRVILSTTGSEAVESALKTARLASGRSGIVAFEGGYHGLTLGSLAVTERAHFRAPFAERAYPGVAFVPFPGGGIDGDERARASLDRVVEALDRGAPNGDAIGTIVVEPVQARGGARIAPPGFMSELSRIAAERDILIVADEIFTGLGRCGALLASQRVGLRPDIVAVGKALGGGLPISACLASRAVMDAWPPTAGEAVHTSTFLGHPLACASALAVLDALDRRAVASEAERVGRELLDGLRTRLADHPRVGEVRGLGLLLGIDLVDEGGRPAVGAAVRVAERALGEGVILLPAGDDGHVVELTPPVTLTKEQIVHVVDVLTRVIEDVS